MQRIRTRIVSCWIGLATVAACTPELPEAAKAWEVPETVKAAAIPLERALEEEMIEVRPIATHSTRNEMAILLKPLVTSQPWIRIDPGWVAKNEKYSHVSYVTCHTVYVRVPKRSNYTVRVRHVRLHWTKGTGMPSDVYLEQNKDETLVSFLKTTGDREEEPDWKELQIAVWALTDDIPYDKVRPQTEGSHIGFRANHQFATAGQVAAVMKLLESAGHDKNSFRLWQTITAELDREVVAYENHWDSDTAKAFVPFRKICNFYPLDVAADVMFSAFDRHEGAKGRDFRQKVVQVLGEHGGETEISLLKQRASYEDDESILKSMRIIIEGAAAPGK